MTDPVLNDLSRHERQLDEDQAIMDRMESLLDEDPSTYEGMSPEKLYEAAREDLEDRATEAAISRHEDMAGDPYYD